MANQYTENFIKIIESRHKQKVRDVLADFQGKGHTYKEVASITGFHVSTIRRNCLKLGMPLRMQKQKPPKTKARKGVTNFINAFKSKEINWANYLSRDWS